MSSCPRFSHLVSKILKNNRKKIVRSYVDGKTCLKVAPYYFPNLTNLIESRIALQRLSNLRICEQANVLCKKMGDKPLSQDSLLPPPVVGMTVLDKTAFVKKCQIPGIKVPNKSIGIVTKKLKSSLLRIPKLKNVAELESTDADYSTHKLVLLDPVQYESSAGFSHEFKLFLEEKGVEISSFKHYDVKLCYENWSVAEIINAMFPELKSNISGFAVIGHIAHLNLKDDALQHKDLIGQVILDKNPSIKTVVNKTSEIDNTFRNFKMELLAGEDNYVTQAKENGFVFELDFSKVYWNPRLGTEHLRVVQEVQAGDTVYDVFAGIGPFAIPAAKSRKAEVIANDLNPNSYGSLCRNVELNKVKNGLKCHNLDGREFIKTVLKQDMLEKWKLSAESGTSPTFRVVMNLPALAIEFTDVFINLFDDIENSLIPETEKLLPYMYVYCFSKSEDPEQDVKNRIEKVIGASLPENYVIRNVRNVAPNKEMMCISFHMPPSVLFGDKDGIGSPDTKRRKISTESNS